VTVGVAFSPLPLPLPLLPHPQPATSSEVTAANNKPRV